jgi:hypothetical protein
MIFVRSAHCSPASELLKCSLQVVPGAHQQILLIYYTFSHHFYGCTAHILKLTNELTGGRLAAVVSVELNSG